MGIPNEVPGYALLAVGLALLVHDGYHTFLRKVSQVQNLLSDKLNSASTLLSSTIEEVLYPVGLPSTFPRFFELPYEVRSQIWQLALPEPRVIEIRNPPGPGSNIRWMYKDRDVRSTCGIPTMLHACHESREEALKVYELSFGMGNTPAKIYVDFARDVVFFGSKGDFYSAQALPISTRPGVPISIVEGLERIRYLALRSRTFGNVEHFDIGKLGSLEEVILIGQLNFTLGPEPCLRREEFGVVFKDTLQVSNHKIALMGKLQKRQEQSPDWKMPTVKRGHFIKVKGDTWYHEDSGRR